MHPVVIEWGKLVIHSYGLMLALSFLLGIWLARWRAKKADLDPNVVSDVGFWIIISAIVGSRLYYVILHPEEFQGQWGAVFNPFHGGQVGIGGLVMYGGFIGAILAGVLFFKLKKLPFLPYADAVAPSIGVGIFLTRIGCFLNGCCFGAPHEGTCSVSFPISSPAGHYQHQLDAAGLYPSQLFESLGGLAIALIVVAVGRKRVFTGLQFYLTGILYAVLRFAVDYSRYYSKDEMIGGLSHNQVVCIALFVLFGGLILKHVLFGEESDAAGEPPPARSGDDRAVKGEPTVGH
jgi:phosphatidylglycerol:prolipoprotein diacylglycerol transferase